MTSAGWALAALAVMLVPGRRAHPPGVPAARTNDPARTQASGQPPARASTATLRAAVAGLAGAACIAVFGPVHGGVGGAVLALLLWSAAGRALQHPVRAAADPSVSLVLDLAAAALRAGRPAADALLLAAPAARSDTAARLAGVAGLLRLGADPAQAWPLLGAQAPFDTVAAAAVRSASSGVKLAASFEQLAVELRRDRVAAGAVRAHRAGVVAMGPLAACFLPSFVCLGVIPVVAGIARTVLGPTRGGP